MIYSIWRPELKAYDYYETPASENDVRAPKPQLTAHKLGLTPDEAAWPLPAKAKYVGRGEFPKGMIARDPGIPLGDFSTSPDKSKWVVVGGLALAAWLLARDER